MKSLIQIYTKYNTYSGIISHERKQYNTDYYNTIERKRTLQQKPIYLCHINRKNATFGVTLLKASVVTVNEQYCLVLFHCYF